LEETFGFSFEVKPLQEARRKGRGGGGSARRVDAGARPDFEEEKKAIALVLPRGMAGRNVEVTVDGSSIFRGSVGRDGRMRFEKRSPVGERIVDAKFKKRDLRVRASE
ncbi:MAG TPA: hypothetical protein VJ400_02310, partial [Thermoplasmata archaeon]|nr:hypothetical protein [Thermoplasmata archaeon]